MRGQRRMTRARTVLTNDAGARAGKAQVGNLTPTHRRWRGYQRCVGADGVKPGCRVGGSVRAYRLKVAVRQHRDMSLE